MHENPSDANRCGARPKVLVVEDNASLRLFVELALQPLNLELLLAESVVAARALMHAHGPCQLVLTDLMMPGVTGLELLRELRASNDWRAVVPAIVFTADASAQVQADLRPLDVYKIMHKPAALAELVGNVEQALAAGPLTKTTSAPAAQVGARETAVATHFAGDHTLFEAFLSQALAQFPIDVRSGDAASTQADVPALRLLAHNLKSVLRMLGDDAGADVAATMENVAAAGDLPAATRHWTTLRAALQGLIDTH